MEKTPEIAPGQSRSGSKLMHRNIILVLIGSIIVANSLIVFSSGKNQVFFSDCVVNVTSAIALGLVLITVYRQKLDGLYGKAFASLAIGLTLWFIAESIWTYFELGLHINTPFPSIADLFWLTGYGFLAYHLYRIYNFVRIKTIKPAAVIVVSIATAIFLGVIISLVIGVWDLSNERDHDTDNNIVLLLVGIAYPILDGMLLVPAVVLLWTVRAGQLVSTHWMLISLSLIVITTADSGFAYIAAIDLNLVQRDLWLWDTLFSTGYILMAAALFWHNKFFILSEKEITKKWQELNR
jgi:diguanylate cyclase